MTSYLPDDHKRLAWWQYPFATLGLCADCYNCEDAASGDDCCGLASCAEEEPPFELRSAPIPKAPKDPWAVMTDYRAEPRVVAVPTCVSLKEEAAFRRYLMTHGRVLSPGGTGSPGGPLKMFIQQKPTLPASVVETTTVVPQLVSTAVEESHGCDATSPKLHGLGTSYYVSPLEANQLRLASSPEKAGLKWGHHEASSLVTTMVPPESAGDSATTSLLLQSPLELSTVNLGNTINTVSYGGVTTTRWNRDDHDRLLLSETGRYLIGG